MTTKRWTIGVVGAGTIGRVHAEVIAHLPNAVFAGCCDGGSGRAKEICRQFGGQAYADYPAMMADPAVDVVTLATPSGLHLEPAAAAAAAGKHVLCEKPLEITLERIDRMIAAHAAAGTMAGRHLSEPLYRRRPAPADGHRAGAFRTHHLCGRLCPVVARSGVL